MQSIFSLKGLRIFSITRIIEFEFDSVFAWGELLSYRAYFNILLPPDSKVSRQERKYEIFEISLKI